MRFFFQKKSHIVGTFSVRRRRRRRRRRPWRPSRFSNANNSGSSRTRDFKFGMQEACGTCQLFLPKSRLASILIQDGCQITVLAGKSSETMDLRDRAC